jgi:hypothetical protein
MNEWARLVARRLHNKSLMRAPRALPGGNCNAIPDRAARGEVGNVGGGRSNPPENWHEEPVEPEADAAGT